MGYEMKFSVFTTLLCAVSGGLLEYNYYSEVSDAVAKSEALSSSLYTMLQYAMRYSLSDAPSSLVEGVTWSLDDFNYFGMIDMVIGDKIVKAALGDCAPFTGYDSDLINLPEWGVYDSGFWCLHM